ncbi:conserved hypothetical protein [Ricinus communis]|uniref:Uncharacterized protein n=1 Tax=Ricinus communis TaxID=3988 RepID=B9SK79_RICCO|nr:conserved hypothetical protein [Ricinus communis]
MLSLKVRTGMILIRSGRLLTNVERKRRHLASLGGCELCNSRDEDMCHILRSYSAAQLAGPSGDTRMAVFLMTTTLPQEILFCHFGSS